MLLLAQEYKFQTVVIEAENGKDAITQLGLEQIDMVLLDWNMPLLSGIDFLRQIKNVAKCKNLPVVMITSEAARESIIEALKEGANEYIIKPVDQVIFRKKIYNIVQSIEQDTE
jgi:two-component system chemotaxis response regulator CheY